MGKQMKRKAIGQCLLLLTAAALFLSFAGAGTASAQDDPPGRVARLNFIDGSVSFQPAGTQDWVEANANRPLTTGDNLWADEHSQSELHIGATAIRIAEQTGISILNLSDATAQIQLAQGTIDVRVRNIGDGEAYEIDTANLAFSILRPGDYRFAVDPNGTTTSVTVRAGAGEATAGGQAYPVNPGQQAIFSGTDQVNYSVRGAPAPDLFDQWTTWRETSEEHSMSAHYVSRDMIGYEDLDQYGHWQNVPDYGNVWVPNGTPGGWAPYHNGHWISVAPWGWTWVEDEPWGFAPFHYGRWAVIGGGWAWVPGPPAVRPVYAPALVAFVGGRGFGVSLEFGGGAGVAWFPLGPRDVFVPGYHTSPRYVENVNITNTTVINRTVINNYYVNNQTNVNVRNVTYMNQNAPGAVTAVSRDTFVNARPVATSTIHVTPQQLQQARVSPGQPLAPSHASVTGPGRVSAASARPPAALAARPVVTKIAPPANAAPMGRVQPHPAVTPAVTGHPPVAVTPGHPPAAPAANSAKPGTPPTQAKPGFVPPGQSRPATTSTVPPPYQNKPGTPAAQPPGGAKPATTNAPPSYQNKPATTPTQPAVKPNYPPKPANPPATHAPQKVTPPPAQQHEGQKQGEGKDQKDKDKKDHKDEPPKQ